MYCRDVDFYVSSRLTFLFDQVSMFFSERSLNNLLIGIENAQTLWC